MKKNFLLIAVLFFISGAAFASDRKNEIMDNSFFLEEAYNQEAGVVQHVQIFELDTDTKEWLYALTQEWPVTTMTNQLSYTIPFGHFKTVGDDYDIGDVWLNYRYQAAFNDRYAFAPRFSIIIPTGNSNKGFGYNTLGLQANLPLSIEAGEYFVTHWNLGATVYPEGKGLSGVRATPVHVFFGGSAIWLPNKHINFLLETIWESVENIIPSGTKNRDEVFFINPGMRGAINFKPGNLQVVPGISAPIGLGGTKTSYGVFFYLSLEHNFR